MSHAELLLLDLFVMFGAAKLLGEICERLRQPAVVGEILAGVLLGPSLLNFIQPDETLRGLAEIGVIFLLFTIGLEVKPAQLLRVGATASLVALLGVLLSFAFGFWYMKASAHPTAESVFLAAAMVATSVGITARVLQDARVLDAPFARLILAAAVLDDILGMIVLALVTSLTQERVHYVQLAIAAAEAIGFCVFIVFFGSKLVSRLDSTVARLGGKNPFFVLSVLLCLGLSLASVYVGMAAIVGAFLAGLALADYSAQWRLQESIVPIYEFLGPFFFVLLGLQVNLHALSQPALLSMLAVVTLIAILSKLIGCSLGALSLGVKDALRVGIGMLPHGEVGLIIASVGLRLKAISDQVYTVALLMSIITTLLAPPILRLTLPPSRRESPSPPVAASIPP